MQARMKIVFALLAVLTAIFTSTVVYVHATEPRDYGYCADRLTDQTPPPIYYKPEELGIHWIKDHNGTLEIASWYADLKSKTPFIWNETFYEISPLRMLWTLPALTNTEAIGSGALATGWTAALGVVIYERKKQHAP
jgi:hypothetical protein